MLHLKYDFLNLLLLYSMLHFFSNLWIYHKMNLIFALNGTYWIIIFCELSGLFYLPNYLNPLRLSPLFFSERISSIFCYNSYVCFLSQSITDYWAQFFVTKSLFCPWTRSLSKYFCFILLSSSLRKLHSFYF